jgi:hypothetical protein
MALFRYFSPEAALRVLKTGELMVIPPKYLNDALECRPVIKCKHPHGFARRKIDEIMTPEFFESQKSVLPVRTFEEYQSILQKRDAVLSQLAVQLVVDADSHLQAEIQDLISKDVGVICFAADGLDHQMWAHYASSHQGLVIEFRQDDPAFSLRSFFPIEYSDEPVVLDASSGITRDDIALLLRRKRSQWSSEMESRLVVPLKEARVRDLPEGRRYFIPIGPKLVVSFTLGLRSNDEIRRTAIELVRRPDFAHVKAFKVHPNVETRLLEREPL